MILSSINIRAMLAGLGSRTRRGQDLTEYALLVAFIAIIVFLAVAFFGTSISNFWVDAGNTLAELLNLDG